MNEDHFANNQWASEWGSLLLRINEKCTRNVKRTSDMALLLIELVESFAIINVNVLIDCEFC